MLAAAAVGTLGVGAGALAFAGGDDAPGKPGTTKVSGRMPLTACREAGGRYRCDLPTKAGFVRLEGVVPKPTNTWTVIDGSGAYKGAGGTATATAASAGTVRFDAEVVLAAKREPGGP